MRQQAVLNLSVFEAFCAEAVAQYGKTTHGILRSLLVGFLATALVLLDRAGHPMPTCPTAEQHAAWTALRDQHALLMPR
ncbi:MAG: hypothetical protein JO362_04675 [Streptomycetaceae bacterium]|nr:hypothetical protein [Streptomycetaceae bacterium]